MTLQTYEKQDIYALTQQFGRRGVSFLKHMSQPLDAATGRLTTSTIVEPLSKVIVLPAKRSVKSEFGYLSNNMKYDSSIMRAYASIIYKKRYSKYEPTQADRFLYAGKQWGIDDYLLYDSYFYASIYSVLESEKIWEMKKENG